MRIGKGGGDNRATDHGESQCQGNHQLFHVRAPSLVSVEFRCIPIFRQKEAAAGVLQQVPVMYMSRTHLPGERR